MGSNKIEIHLLNSDEQYALQIAVIAAARAVLDLMEVVTWEHTQYKFLCGIMMNSMT